MAVAEFGALACAIRRARLGDLDGVVGLCAEHARYERAEYDAAGKAERLASALFGAAPRLHAWVAALDGALIGYATATAEFSTWRAAEYLHLDCLYVRDGQRGAGVGAALLGAVMQFAREHGYPQVQWQTPQWNGDAARFYRRQGATDQAKLRFVLDVKNR